MGPSAPRRLAVLRLDLLWALLIALGVGCGAEPLPTADSGAVDAATGDATGDATRTAADDTTGVATAAPGQCPHLTNVAAAATILDQSTGLTWDHKDTRLIDFARIAVGDVVHFELVVMNWGASHVRAPLRVLGVSLDDPTGFLGCQVMMPDGSVRPCDGSAVDVAVASARSPANCGVTGLHIRLAAKRFAGLAPREGTLRIAVAGDPAHYSAPLILKLRTKTGSAFASFDPPAVYSPNMATGTTKTQVVVVKNTGSTPLLISDLGLTGDADVVSVALDGVPYVTQGQVAGAPVPVSGVPLSPWLSVPAGGQRTLTLRLHAPDAAMHEAQLWLQTNDTLAAHPDGRRTLSLVVNPPCPVAKPKVLEGEAVLPGTTLHLQGDSADPWFPASIAIREWTVTPPGGSKPPVVLTSTAKTLPFLATVVGDYTFCLRIKTSADTWSCSPSCRLVTVSPQKEVYIELSWSTPSDPDPWDVGPISSPDLDLHFARSAPKGADLDCDGTPDPWYSVPFDTFWFNPKPDWGVPLKSHDDPELLLSDNEVAGAEAVSVAGLQGSTSAPKTYAIGVHYFNNYKFGTSYATVRLFLNGVLAETHGPVALDVLDLWEVGRLIWKGSKAVDQAGIEVCRQSAELCKEPGSKWVASGEPCVTHCYKSPGFPVSASCKKSP